MSRIDAGFAMVADRTRRNAGAVRGSDAVRDGTDAKAESPRPEGDKSESRELVVVNPKETPGKGKPSRYADALFLAHVFASKFDAPQQREKRRADPADANASYRKSAKRPVKTGRVLSKKV
jgi:hypothetical protein